MKKEALITAGKIKRTCLKAQFQRIMRHMQIQHMRNFSRSQYEEGSCTHSLSKKGKEEKWTETQRPMDNTGVQIYL